MALPTSRDFTYTPAAAVRSADLNNLQDCIIGAKHPEIEYGHSHSSFIALPGGGGTLGAGSWTFAASTTLVSPIRSEEVGTRITSVKWFYNRGGAGTITMRLRRSNADGSVTTVQEDTDVTGAAFETNTIVYNHTLVTDCRYWLEVVCDNAAHVFFGANRKADRL